MPLSSRRVVGVPVKTRSGRAVGRLTDILFEADTGRIAFLIVRARGFIPGLLDQELRIAWSQVLSVTEKEAVVADGSVPTGASRLAAAFGRRPVPPVAEGSHPSSR